MGSLLARARGLFACALFAAPAAAEAQVSLTGTFIDYVHVGTNGGILNSRTLPAAMRRSMRYRETTTTAYSCDTFGPGEAVEEFALSGQVVGMLVPVTVTQSQFTTVSAPTATGRTMTWTGRSSLTAMPLEVAQSVAFNDMDRHITVSVRVTNRGLLTISNLHYLRNGDPDFAINGCNEAMGGFETANDVVRQGTTHPDALVIACSRPMQTPFFCLGLGAAGTNARAHVATALSNTNPVATWTTPRDSNGLVEDRGISLAFRNEPTLAPGASVTFTFNYVWGTSPTEVIDRFEGLYCLPATLDQPITFAEGAMATLRAYPNRPGAMFSWDLDNDGMFETMGNPITFNATMLDGPSTARIAVRYTAPDCATRPETTSATVNINNVAPSFTSRPTTSATPDIEYSYTPAITDPAGLVRDPPTFRLVSGPMGMTVDPATGRVRWTPTAAMSGMSFMVTIEVNDGDGGVTRQSWTIIVGRVCADGDMDGFPDAACGGNDCNDGNAMINPGAREVCDGVDNNCDTVRDEGFMLGTACNAGVGACRATGMLVCAADGASAVCNAVPSMPGRELCGDMIDNDCNGMVDDGFNIGEMCTAGLGACARMGMFVCAPGGMGATCSATAATPGAETCNGIDDDCDGTVDNGSLCASNMDGTRCSTVGMATFCGCTMDGDCAADRRCNPTTNRCEPRPPTDAGTSDAAADGSPDSGSDGSTSADGGGDGSTNDGSAGDASTMDASAGDGGAEDGSTSDGSTTDASTMDASAGDASNNDGGAGDGSAMDSQTTGDGSSRIGVLSGDGACACRAPAAPANGAKNTLALLATCAAIALTVSRRRRAKR
ncbi:MAG: hypothetical protein JNK05_40245 [Myxococcales bacterium]|nr:hypothetical protein [Myxococcales bacterium]